MPDKDEPENENYDFYATVRMPHETVNRVRCKLWLPRRITDPIRMVFYPTQRQASHHFDRPNPMAVEGRIIGFGRDVVTIRATEAWVDTIPRRSLSKTRRETVFEADPINLQIILSRPRERKRHGAMKADVSYILTPSPRELTPVNVLDYMDTGAVKSRTVRKFAFALRGGRRLDFVKRYHHESRGDEDIAWRQLVALHKRSVSRTDFARVDNTLSARRLPSPGDVRVAL